MTTTPVGRKMSDLVNLAEAGMTVPGLPYSLRRLGIERREPTRKGRPMVHWVRCRYGSGWVAPGTYQPIARSFWGNLVAAASVMTGHLNSTVHGVGPGLLVAGPFAIPLLDRRLVLLLDTALTVSPRRFLLHMGKAIARDEIAIVEKTDGVDREITLATRGREVASESELRVLVRGSKDDAHGKERLHDWVAGLHDLLRFEPRIHIAWAIDNLPPTVTRHGEKLAGLHRVWNEAVSMDEQELRSVVMLAHCFDPMAATNAAEHVNLQMETKTPAPWRQHAFLTQLGQENSLLVEDLNRAVHVYAPWKAA